MSPSLAKLASKDLLVFTAESPGFHNAIASRAFNGKLPKASAFPHAVVQAKSANAVQEVVKYCRDSKMKMCVRSGGHSWETVWLQGKESVLLDVGDLKDIRVDPDSKSVTVGPGAPSNQVLDAVLAHNLFFPCGHCKGVPVGGFLLGGGNGIGFSKYGLSCSLIQEMDVVTADGSLIKARANSDDPKEQALLKLAMGSYASFPGVITQFTLGPLPPTPKVFRGSVMYALEQWIQALDLGRATSQDEAIETTIILTYAPPAVAAATGAPMVAIVALDIFANNGLELWEQHVSKIAANDVLVPLEPPKLCNPSDMPDLSLYPTNARFQSQVYVGKDGILHDKMASKDALQPLIDMWLSEHKPPPPSHSLLVCAPPNLPSDYLAYGFKPSLGVMTYAVYTDENQDETFRQQLASAHVKLAESSNFHTSLVEGSTRQNGAKSGFTEEAYQQAREYIHLLDPEGVFAGFPKKEIE